MREHLGLQNTQTTSKSISQPQSIKDIHKIYKTIKGKQIEYKNHALLILDLYLFMVSEMGVFYPSHGIRDRPQAQHQK